MRLQNIAGLLLISGLLIACRPSQNVVPLMTRLYGLSDPLLVTVTGTDFRWNFVACGADGIPGTQDDVSLGEKLSLPSHRRVRMRLESTDYVYTFRQDELGINEMAIPGINTETEFVSSAAGTYRVEASPLCGFLFLHADYEPEILVSPDGYVSPEGNRP